MLMFEWNKIWAEYGIYVHVHGQHDQHHAVCQLLFLRRKSFALFNNGIS